MQVKSIAECSKGSILQYFRPTLSYKFVIKIFVLSIFELPFYTGFTVKCTNKLDYATDSSEFSHVTDIFNHRMKGWISPIGKQAVSIKHDSGFYMSSKVRDIDLMLLAVLDLKNYGIFQ